MAQEFVEHGVLEEDDAEDSRWSHVLWNVVGGDSDDLKPEVYKAELKIGDTILLCTDGLTKHVNDASICDVLGSKGTAESSCVRLVDSANARGGSDNITVIVARFCDAAEQPLAAAEATMEITDDNLGESSLEPHPPEKVAQTEKLADTLTMPQRNGM